MMRETLRLWNEAVLSYDSGDLAKTLQSLELIAEPTAKILFNMGCVYFRQGFPNKALQSFQQTVIKDEHLSVGYFQCGVAAFKVNRVSDAVENFQKAYFYMRSCTVIDYRQLGLQYTLFTVEILLNLALCMLRKDDSTEALKWLKDAASIQSDSRLMTAIFDAIKSVQSGSDFNLRELPSAVLFRPSKDRVANLEKRDYLGKAKVIASLNENDTFTGFVGPKKVSESNSSESHSLPSSPESPRKAVPLLSNLKKAFSRSTEDLLRDKSSPKDFAHPGENSRPKSSISNSSQSSAENEESTKRRPPPPNVPPPRLPNRKFVVVPDPTSEKGGCIESRSPNIPSVPTSNGGRKPMDLDKGDRHSRAMRARLTSGETTQGQRKLARPTRAGDDPDGWVLVDKPLPTDHPPREPTATTQREKPGRPFRPLNSNNSPDRVEDWCSGVPLPRDRRIHVTGQQASGEDVIGQPKRPPRDANSVGRVPGRDPAPPERPPRDTGPAGKGSAEVSVAPEGSKTGNRSPRSRSSQSDDSPLEVKENDKLLRVPPSRPPPTPNSPKKSPSKVAEPTKTFQTVNKPANQESEAMLKKTNGCKGARSQTVIAIENHEADNPDQLSFREGDIISLINHVEESCFQGRLFGKTGLVPWSCVKNLEKKTVFG